MAKKKTTTKKKATPKQEHSESLSKAVDDLNDGMFSPKIEMESFKENPKEKKPLTEADIDNEVKEALKMLGAIQSKYQQLGRTNKAKKLRNSVRLFRTSYKEWK